MCTRCGCELKPLWVNYGPFISGKKKEEEEDVSVAIRCVCGGSYKGGSFVFPTRSSQREERENIYKNVEERGVNS